MILTVLDVSFDSHRMVNLNLLHSMFVIQCLKDYDELGQLQA